jgi:hypothetical protein
MKQLKCESCGQRIPTECDKRGYHKFQPEEGWQKTVDITRYPTSRHFIRVPVGCEDCGLEGFEKFFSSGEIQNNQGQVVRQSH